MIDLTALITWAGMISIISIIARTAYLILALHYRDQEKQRLERLDAELANPELTAERRLVQDIVKYTDETRDKTLFSLHVLNKLVEAGKITDETARKIKW